MVVFNGFSIHIRAPPPDQNGRGISASPGSKNLPSLHQPEIVVLLKSWST
jgi:hypothetical protein